MNAKHTPEPWGIHPDFVDDKPTKFEHEETDCVAQDLPISSGETIVAKAVFMFPNFGHEHVPSEEEMRANARRIVACVNACAGMSDPETEIAELKADNANMARDWLNCQKQRDALLAALKCWPLNELLGLVEDSGDEKMWERAKWFMEVRDTAIAAIESGKVPT